MSTKRLFKKPLHMENGKISQYDVALHGCALIFSKKYYKKYKDVFYNETFLYHEEEFLNYRKNRDNLITYYDANLEIFHKEGASLNNRFNNNYEKLIFRNKEIVKSLKLLEDVMKNNKEI
jgi:GT2 family glycosyltransferase